MLGRFIYNDGVLYEGLIRRGLRHGKGVLVEGDNYKYMGSFLNGRKEGQGEEIL